MKRVICIEVKKQTNKQIKNKAEKAGKAEKNHQQQTKKKLSHQKFSKYPLQFRRSELPIKLRELCTIQVDGTVFARHWA